MKIQTSSEQKALAKKHRRPLVCIGFNDQHLTKAEGGSVGEITFCGPLKPELAAEFHEFMRSIMRRNGAK